MVELRPYQKRLKRINETQATCQEGEITRQGCGFNTNHPLVYMWLDPKDRKAKGRWVLGCLECGYYKEVLE